MAAVAQWDWLPHLSTACGVKLPVFISYSHSDKTFVDELARRLVQARTAIWLDRSELTVGD